MIETKFVTALDKLVELNEAEKSKLLSRFQLRSIKKKSRLLEARQVAGEIYFVLDGCLRLFYEKEGEDISAYFFMEGTFAGAYDSFTTRKPSLHFIEALEHSRILSISYDNFQKLFLKVPKMENLVRKLLEERFVSLHNLFTSHILDSPEERYLKLLKEQPELLKRVPQRYLATFLGVSAVSLSRIRSRIAQKP